MKRLILILFGLSGCVGTDFIDDPIIGENIVVEVETLALMANEQTNVTAMYFDQYGIKRPVSLKWQSSNSAVAEINNAGLIAAKAVGQTIIQPYVGDFLGPQIQVTVVGDVLSVATVELLAPMSTNLMGGDKVQLQVMVKNVNGEVLNGKTIEWFSENNTIITVSQSGKIEAVDSGVAGIHAKVEGVKSNIIDFTVTSLSRMGTFVSAGGYHTSGSGKLEMVNDQLMLTLNGNFDTDFALGTFIYLSNSTNGGTVRTMGFEVGQIFIDGEKTFNISQLNAMIELNTYRYVIVLCKPASVTFGFADLK